MVDLDIKIDRSESKPIYEQISSQIRKMIAVGDLTDGDSLPTVRKLSSQLGISRLTAFKAYVELQQDGLIESRVGRGTVVRLRAPGWSSSLEGQFLDEPDLMRREEEWDQSQILSLATALPDPSLFAQDKFVEYFQSLRGSSPWTFSAAESDGEPLLREQGAELLKHLSPHWKTEDVLVTPGLMTGQLLAVASVVGRGNEMAVQDPNWLGMYAQLDRIGVRPHPVIQTADGLDTEHLENLAKGKGIKALMVSPDHSWGNGLSLPVDNRERILELADKYGFTVIETVGQSRIHFAGRSLEGFASLANGSDCVVTEFDLCSCLSSGLGVGLLALKGEKRRLATDVFKSAATPAKPLQAAMAEFLKDDQFDSHMGRAVPAYRARKEAMVRSLKSTLPKGSIWTKPSGGYVLEIALPGVDVVKLQSEALSAGVSIVPGTACSTLPGAEERIRLSFAMMPPERIIRAVVALGRVLKTL